MAGYRVLTIPSDEKGCMDIRRLEESLDEDVAALMLTNPNTLGIFEDDILKIAEMVHDQGASLYYDGANLNALMGWIRPGEMGFDLMHFNLHKTFSTPHGGGGPGSGPIGARGEFVDYLPVPLIGLCDEIYREGEIILRQHRPPSEGLRIHQVPRKRGGKGGLNPSGS
jgi:glycine dehydrogenase subunit 2